MAFPEKFHLADPKKKRALRLETKGSRYHSNWLQKQSSQNFNGANRQSLFTTAAPRWVRHCIDRLSPSGGSL